MKSSSVRPLLLEVVFLRLACDFFGDSMVTMGIEREVVRKILDPKLGR
jgi:hypothetical protein